MVNVRLDHYIHVSKPVPTIMLFRGAAASACLAHRAETRCSLRLDIAMAMSMLELVLIAPSNCARFHWGKGLTRIMYIVIESAIASATLIQNTTNTVFVSH